MIPSSRMHDNTLFTFKSKMAAGLTPVLEDSYISCSGADTIIVLKSFGTLITLERLFLRFKVI